jgi:selenoprotein W-related protein
LTGDLFHEYENRIDTLTLVPSDGGKFEISVDGELIFSKLKVGRHPDVGEVTALFDEYREE